MRGWARPQRPFPSKPMTSTRWWPRGAVGIRRGRADPAGSLAAAADGSRYAADHEPVSRVGASAVRPRHHRRRGRLVDVAMSGSQRQTLVLRFADVGIATYASLRVVGQPSRTVTWVVEEPTAGRGAGETAPLPALPGTRDGIDEHPGVRDAGSSARSPQSWCAADRHAGWSLSSRTRCWAHNCSPSARLAACPGGLLAVRNRAQQRGAGSSRQERSRPAAGWPSGSLAAGRCPETDGYRLMELVDVLMAVPPNIVQRTAHAARLGQPAGTARRLLVLDPRVPGQRPDSPLGSVLGRPSAGHPVGEPFHRADAAAARCCRASQRRSSCSAARTPAAHGWPACWRKRRAGCSTSATRRPPTGTSAMPTARRCTSRAADGPPVDGVGPDGGAGCRCRPGSRCWRARSGGDYQFDEATGLVAAMILGGAQLVTATLWSLPTAAAYRQFAADVRLIRRRSDGRCDRRRRRRPRGRRRRVRGESLAARTDAALAGRGRRPPARCIGPRWSRSRSTARGDAHARPPTRTRGPPARRRGAKAARGQPDRTRPERRDRAQGRATGRRAPVAGERVAVHAGLDQTRFTAVPRRLDLDLTPTNPCRLATSIDRCRFPARCDVTRRRCGGARTGGRWRRCRAESGQQREQHPSACDQVRDADRLPNPTFCCRYFRDAPICADDRGRARLPRHRRRATPAGR